MIIERLSLGEIYVYVGNIISYSKNVFMTRASDMKNINSQVEKPIPLIFSCLLILNRKIECQSLNFGHITK